MSIIYNKLQARLKAAAINSELYRMNKHWHALRIPRKQVTFSQHFWVRHSRRGWFLGDQDVFRIPDAEKVADACIAWSNEAAPREEVIRSFGLELQHSWLKNEFAADEDLWASVGWQICSEAEDKIICDTLENRLNYPRSPFVPPRPSATWVFSYLFDRDLRTFEQVSEQLNYATLRSFRQSLKSTESLFAIDWNHSSYRLVLNAVLNSGDAELWPISVFPNGDYHLFVSDDFQMGIVTDPTNAQVCVFGRQLPHQMALEFRKSSLEAKMINTDM